MDLGYRVNQSGGGSAAIYSAYLAAIDASWTCVKSSDGTTVSTPGSVPNLAYLQNQSAWLLLRDPGGRREICLHRSATAGTTGDRFWTQAFSELARFTGGTGAARPTATDEAVVRDRSTTWVANGVTYNHHAIFAKEPVGDVYGFWIFHVINGQATVRASFCCEPLQPGSFHASDVSPCIWISGDNNFGGFARADSYYQSANSWKGWHKYGLSGAAFQTFTQYLYDSQSVSGEDCGAPADSSSGLGANPYDTSRSSGIAMLVGRATSATSGRKGATRYMAWKGANHAYPDTANLASDDAFVYLTEALVPWPTGVTPTNGPAASVDYSVDFLRFWPEAAAADVTAPTVDNFDPAPGADLDGTDTQSFDVTDDVALRKVIVSAHFPASGDHEVVWDGDEFAFRYGASTRSAITDGYTYSLRRRDGWPGGPVNIRVVAIDTSGNEAT